MTSIKKNHLKLAVTSGREGGYFFGWQHSQGDCANKKWLLLSGNLSNITLFTLVWEDWFCGTCLMDTFRRNIHKGNISLFTHSEVHWDTDIDPDNIGDEALAKDRRQRCIYCVEYMFTASEGWKETSKHRDCKAATTWSCQSETAAATQWGCTHGGGGHQFERHNFGLLWFLAGFWSSTQLCLYGNLAYLIQYMAGCW